MIRTILAALLTGLGLIMLASLVAVAATWCLALALRWRERWKERRTPRACRSCGERELVNKFGRCKACEWVRKNWYELEYHFALVVLEVRQIVWARRPH